MFNIVSVAMLLNQQERPPMKYLIEINFSQIRALEIKREKICAVCPYLLFVLFSSQLLGKLKLFIISLLLFKYLTEEKQY